MKNFDPAFCHISPRGEREAFTLSETQQQLLREWIQQSLRQQKGINQARSSYGLKHIAERALGFYVANCDLKRAMHEAGYKHRVCFAGSGNWLFNISESSPAFTGRKQHEQ